MNKVKTLTKQIAQQFLADEDSVDLSKFISMDDAAAVALAKHEGELDLSGLKSLSDVAAKSFAKQNGELDLNLRGLRSLSDAAAEALAKRRDYLDLNLDGLKSLSDAAAKALAKTKGDLGLNGLKTLSDAAAEALAEHEGELYFDGLKSLSDTAAEALAKRERDLFLMDEGLEMVMRARKRLASKKAKKQMPKAKANPPTSSVRRFEFVDGASSKFWETELRGSDLATRWGRIGANGQEKVKRFGAPEAAAKEQAALIAEKTGKGYREV